MPTYVTTGLPNAGVTTPSGVYKVSYDNSLSAADGLNKATALMADLETDFNIMNGWFNNIGLPFATPMTCQLTGQAGGWSASWSPLTLSPTLGSALDLARFLVVAEVTEMLMWKQAKGWFGAGDEGSTGEGLSHFLATQFLISIGSPNRYSSLSSIWLNPNNYPEAGPAYPDWVNNTDTTDNSNSQKSACSLLFLWYLCTQLGFGVNTIVQAAGADLGVVYKNLTGDANDPFPYFKQLLTTAYPSPTGNQIPGPNWDNPWPLGALSFVASKTTYGHDEVQASLASASAGRFNDAFSVALDGFNSQTLGANTPGLSGPATTFAGLLLPADAAGVQYQSANHLIPQRITFPYDSLFSAASLPAFPSTGTEQEALDGAISIAGKPFSGSTPLTFEAAGYPYFANLNPAAGNVLWLSQDLRVFTASPGFNNQPVAGGPTFATDSFAGAYAYIQTLLTWLNANYSDPSGADPFDLNTGVLPNQTGAYSGDSSVTPTTTQGGSTHNNYNFAIARVRLNGTAGTPGQTDNVRVFFRVWSTQSADTDFQPSTYPSHTDAAGLPDYPLIPADAHTIPFFATGNNPPLGSAGDPEYGPSGVNNQNLTIQSGGSLWAYYGCFINVYDPAMIVNGSQVQTWLAGDHHCIVAQIAYDGDPIVAPANPGDSDKLAQRNLQITQSGNPGWPATHRVPQTFDLRGVLVGNQGAAQIASPDELLIEWGKAPKGTVAQIFWPGADAAQIIDVASRLYGPHQLSVAGDAESIRFEVDGDVSYIPIPTTGPDDLSGLLTLDLPSSVVYGQEIKVTLQRVTTRRLLAEEPIQLQAASNPAGASRTSARRNPRGTAAAGGIATEPQGVIEGGARIREGKPPSTHTSTWRQVTGSFQIKVPVTPEERMLPEQEDMLAVFRWRLQAMPAGYRWRRAVERYTEYLAEKVDALGGHSERIPPSLGGRPGKHHLRTAEDDLAFTGKVVGIRYDRFGDFTGFTMRLENGLLRSFRSHEKPVAELVHDAWAGRYLISVHVDRRASDWPETIVLRRS